MSSCKVRIEIDVWPEAALSLRDQLNCIYAAMHRNEDPQKLTTQMALACGISMAIVHTICAALPKEQADG